MLHTCRSIVIAIFPGNGEELPHHSQFPNFLEMTTQKKKKKIGKYTKTILKSQILLCVGITPHFKEVQGIVQTIRNLSPFTIANRGWKGVDHLYCPKSGADSMHNEKSTMAGLECI